jgi:hypothetical protein
VSIIHIELRAPVIASHKHVAHTIKSFNAHHKSVQLLLGACVFDDCDIWLLLALHINVHVLLLHTKEYPMLI